MTCHILLKSRAGILALLAAAFLCFISGCKKDPEVYYVSAQLKTDFAFHKGSYWIYRDALTGDIDSAYVEDYVENTSPSSCVNPVARRQYINMIIKRISLSHADTVADHDREWRLTLVDNKLNMSCPNDEDSIAGRQSLVLATYPFKVGQIGDLSGCLISSQPDSGCISRIESSIGLNGNTYANTAISGHTNIRWSRMPDALYNDVMYISPRTGIVKAVINHIPNDVRHVWELQRYHIAQ